MSKITGILQGVPVHMRSTSCGLPGERPLCEDWLQTCILLQSFVMARLTSIQTWLMASYTLVLCETL